MLVVGSNAVDEGKKRMAELVSQLGYFLFLPEVKTTLLCGFGCSEYDQDKQFAEKQKTKA